MKPTGLRISGYALLIGEDATATDICLYNLAVELMIDVRRHLVPVQQRLLRDNKARFRVPYRNIRIVPGRNGSPGSEPGETGRSCTHPFRNALGPGTPLSRTGPDRCQRKLKRGDSSPGRIEVTVGLLQFRKTWRVI